MKLSTQSQITDTLDSQENLSTLCQYLDWDSDFFGRRIGRIRVDRIRAEDVEAIEQWCANYEIECIYFLADVNDQTSVRLAEDIDFHLVDVRLTLERELDDFHPKKNGIIESVIRPYKPSDIQALRTLAKTSFQFTRFYSDKNFPKERSDSLYMTWVEKSCKGYADLVMVADFQGQVVGFVTCQLSDQDQGKIGLTAVSGKWQGRGIGQQLVEESLSWFVQKMSKHVSVVTQGGNYPAQRLYQRHGFITKSVHLWFHKWFK